MAKRDKWWYEPGKSIDIYAVGIDLAVVWWAAACRWELAGLGHSPSAKI